MIGLNTTCTVLSRGAGGHYDVTVKTGLKCRLAHVSLRPAASSTDRSDLAMERRLLWEPDYAMPDGCMVQVDGSTWRVVRGTIGRYTGPSGTNVYRAAEVIRQDT